MNAGAGCAQPDAVPDRETLVQADGIEGVHCTGEAGQRARRR